MNSKLFCIVSFVSIFLFGCATPPASKFSGRFSCPDYKGDNNQWTAYESTSEHQVVNGVDLIVIKYEGANTAEKLGPYKASVQILDGMWRYYPLYRNNTLYPIKVKHELKERKEKLNWYAEYPDVIDNKGKKQEAHKGEGSLWIDSNGDQIATATHFKGEYKCKRLKNK